MSGEANVAVVRAIVGESTCFEVRSSSNPSEWHRVELKAHGGAGECACIRWQTVCWPIIRDTGSLPPARRCRHLKAAREFYTNAKIAQEPAYE